SFSCSTTVKIPVMNNAPAGFMEFMKGGRDIGIYVYKKQGFNLNVSSDWRTTVHGAILNSIQKKGYFRIVDLSSREARLKEVAHSQRIGGMKDISKELSVDGLLFIEVTQPPSSECKTESRSRNDRVCSAYNNQGKCVSYRNQVVYTYIKTLVFTVYAKGRLVNLETGQAREYTNTTPAVLSNRSNLPSSSCPTQQEGFDQALLVASEKITEQLSPEMSEFEVPLLDDGTGVVDSDIKSSVKDSLKGGNKWLDTDTPNLDLAKVQWERALTLSNNNSVSAHWNLGIYHWSRGNVDQAEQYFNNAIQKGGPDWMDSKKMEVISKFKAEKDRIKLEKENDGF
ncbi:MAG: hypothetical protein KDK36_12100, partial [Leptospiraceae bacterium]|nr:hypothetical protein [Leptospiraceae bacterium]